MWKTQEWRGNDPRWVAAQQEKITLLLDYILCKKLNLVSFITIYVANFLPHIPYTVVLPEDVQVGRNMLQNKTISLKQKKLL
jgi:hypothetical protein